MIQISNAAAQTLAPGQAISFDKTSYLHTGCGECFNTQLATSVKLRGGCGAIYEIQFSGNVTSTTAGDTVQLAITVGGQPLVETAMNATPAAAGTLVNVNTGTLFAVYCCDADRVSVVNTGTTTLSIAPNSNLRIVRKT